MKPFFYLSGPMTGVPCYNFPRFREAAYKLRERGYTIVNPAELGVVETEARFMASEDGRDQGIIEFYDETVEHPACVGGILLEGWLDSQIATVEARTLKVLGKPLHCYQEDYEGRPVLQMLAMDFVIG